MAGFQNSEEAASQDNNRHTQTKGGNKRGSSQNPPKSPWTDLFKQSKETVDSSLKLKFCPPKNGTDILEEHEVENYPKLKGIPPSVSTFPPLKIVDCKRNGNEWRWNKENLTPESVEPNTVEKLVERSVVGVHSEVQEAAISVEPTESDTLADCVDNAAIFTTSEQICEVEQTNDMDEFKRTLEMDDRVHEDQTDLSPDGSEFSVSDQEGDSPSNLPIVSSQLQQLWEAMMMRLSLPSFGQFAFDKELIAYQLKANKAHKEFVAFQKEANRVCKEYVAMKKGRSEDLSSAMPAAGSPPKAFDFRAALMSSPKTRHGGNVRKNSKEIPSPLRVISLSCSMGRKRPGATVK
nr:hypothetical protein Iba_chr07cCG7810 [Ipomoea batatas]